MITWIRLDLIINLANHFKTYSEYEISNVLFYRSQNIVVKHLKVFYCPMCRKDLVNVRIGMLFGVF